MINGQQFMTIGFMVSILIGIFGGISETVDKMNTVHIQQVIQYQQSAESDFEDIMKDTSHVMGEDSRLKTPGNEFKVGWFIWGYLKWSIVSFPIISSYFDGNYTFISALGGILVLYQIITLGYAIVYFSDKFKANKTD